MDGYGKHMHFFHLTTRLCLQICDLLAYLIVLSTLQSRDPGCFHQSRIRDWQRLNPAISALQKLAKIVLFHVLNERNKNILPLCE